MQKLYMLWDDRTYLNKVKHMSRQTPLQRRIILHLAKNEPQTKNEIAQGIKSDYKSAWIALRKLEKKHLIKTVRTEFYRGNYYPNLWLTELGISLALDEGAKPEPLLKQVLETYSENKILHFLIEAVPILGNYVAHILSQPSSNEHAEEELVAMLAAEALPTLSPASLMREEFDRERIIRLKTLLKKYPEFYHHFTDELRRITENLKTISTLLEGSE